MKPVSISLIDVHDIDFLVDILEVEKLPPSNKEIEDIVSYDWKIDTKYYTAEIKLCSTTKRTVGTEEFADGVQAVVIYFNADQVLINWLEIRPWSLWPLRREGSLSYYNCNDMEPQFFQPRRVSLRLQFFADSYPSYRNN